MNSCCSSLLLHTIGVLASCEIVFGRRFRCHLLCYLIQDRGAAVVLVHHNNLLLLLLLRDRFYVTNTIVSTRVNYLDTRTNRAYFDILLRSSRSLTGSLGGSSSCWFWCRLLLYLYRVRLCIVDSRLLIVHLIGQRGNHCNLLGRGCLITNGIRCLASWSWLIIRLFLFIILR